MRTFLPTCVALGTVVLALPAMADTGDQMLKLLPADGAANYSFGRSVGLSGGTIVAGSPNDDENGVAAGSAHLFAAVSGFELFKLLADDGQAGDGFGFSVASDDGIVVVGAYLDDDNGVDSGSVYLFDQATGAQLVKILPDDGAAGDEFGYSVAIEDGVVVVGSKRDDDDGVDSGSAYLFDASTGIQLRKISADDATANDNFGGAVAIDSGVVAVGAHAKWNGPLFLAGAAYLFDAATGEQVHKLLPDDAAVSDFFGYAVDIDSGEVVVGAWSKSIVFDHSGAAYLFDASTGDQIGSRLTPSDTADRDNFGYAVAIDSGVVALSAPGDSDGGIFEAGSVYVFDAASGDQLMELRADDRAPLDNLGSGVALADGLLVVGAEKDDDNGMNSGSAYVFAVGGGCCSADFDGTGTVDSDDLAFLLAAWGTPAADLNGDGTTGASDLAILLASWG